MATALKDAPRVDRRNESCSWPALESVADVVRQTRNTVADVRQATRMLRNTSSWRCDASRWRP